MKVTNKREDLLLTMIDELVKSLSLQCNCDAEYLIWKYISIAFKNHRVTVINPDIYEGLKIFDSLLSNDSEF